jgi:hypothetical protein
LKGPKKSLLFGRPELQMKAFFKRVHNSKWQDLCEGGCGEQKKTGPYYTTSNCSTTKTWSSLTLTRPSLNYKGNRFMLFFPYIQGKKTLKSLKKFPLKNYTKFACGFLHFGIIFTIW